MLSVLGLLSLQLAHAASPVAPASIPAQSATEGQSFNFTAPQFTDPDGDPLTYSFSGLPAWLSVPYPAQNSRYLAGRPPYSESTASVQKSYTISLTAKDPSNAQASQTFTLQVVNVNTLPSAPASIPTQAATEGVAFSYTVPRFPDQDGDVLTYSFTGLPVWLGVPYPTQNPRYLSGKPPYSESSASTQKSYTINVTARDPSNATASKAFTLNVVNGNATPVPPTTIPAQVATEGVAFSYTVPQFSDADGEVISYSFTGLPTWLTVTYPLQNPRYLAGRPPPTEATVETPKIYSITVTGTDSGGRHSSKSFSLTVLDSGALVAGLDSRPSNTTCIAPARPQPATGVQLSRVFTNLSFSSPLGMIQAPGDTSRWFVWQQGGIVKVFANTANVATSSNFINITSRVLSGGELGLLGMAFHPDWPTTREVFLSYTRSSPSRQSVISRFTSTDGGATLDPASEQILLTVNQPYDNHNGGNIVFGPDGMLYIGFGDGGSSGDPGNRSQNLTTLLGKMLRINVNGTGATYTIPVGNTYAANTKCTTGSGSAACPEIWAFGFRNPWRWSFDRLTGELWMGDVGQNRYEEVNRVTQDGNYGWRQREGAHCYNPSSGCVTPGSLLNGGIVIDPVTEYRHTAQDSAGGDSITGGYVYRGAAIPALSGLYVFGDEVTGRIWSHTPGETGMQRALLLDTSLLISSFAEDSAGELYALNYSNGQINKLLPSSGSGTNTIPTSLVDTGCVDPNDPKRPAAGLIPYQPNAPFWSDGAVKGRWIGLPNGQAITAGTGDWEFPNGTVLVKDFRLANKLIETRLFMRHPDGVWGGYTYEWNDTETTATRVIGGKTKVIGTQTWVYPSESQCLQCHTEAAGRSLGLETMQQNGNFLYPSTGRTANQVVTLNGIGAIVPAIAGTPATLPALPNPYGTTGTLTERARAYLHSNCSQCHRPGGPTPSSMDLRYTTALSATNACNATPTAGNLGLGASARIVSPGNPGLSVLLARMQSLDTQLRMPPLGSRVVDAAGAQLLQDWITQLGSCTP